MDNHQANQRPFHTEILGSARSINGSVSRLHDLVDCMHAVGMDTPAGKIAHELQNIRRCLDTIERAVDDKLNEDYQAGMQSSVNMLNAALAVVGSNLTAHTQPRKP